MEIIETRSPSGTVAFGRRLAGRLSRGDCVALIGPLGAGKTILVRGIVEGLGVTDGRIVSSPTFVLVKEYCSELPVYHVDLYRAVRGEAELAELGIEEMLGDGVVVIEWAERARTALPHPRWEVHIDPSGPRSRRLSIQRID
jgi:tRNA threonylcarbamoyladenosine biosynthesis protein TsaE